MASETQKLTVGITGATGRLATILIRQFKGKYHLRLFSFEKPECASSVLLYSITHSTRNTLSGTDKETLTTEKEHYDTTVVDLSRREEVAGRLATTLVSGHPCLPLTFGTCTTPQVCSRESTF